MHKLIARLLAIFSLSPLIACFPPIGNPPLSAAQANPGRLAFKRALSLFQAGKWEAARENLEVALRSYHRLEDYQLYFLAQVEAKLGQKERAQALYLKLTRKFPRSIWQPAALLALASSAWDKGDYAQARKLASRVARHQGADQATRLEARLLGLRLMELDDPKQAFARYYELRSSSDPEVATRARRNQAALRAKYVKRLGHLPPALLLKEANALLAEGSAPRAIEVLRKNEAAFTDHELRPRQLLILARALASSKGIEDAAKVYEQILREHSKSEAAPTALYELAYVFWNRNRNAEAKPLFERLINLYPGSQRHPWSLYALARIAEEAGRFASALRNYQRLAALPAPADLQAEARWRIGWIHYLAGEHEKAIQAFAQAAPGIAGEASALYWEARAAEQLEKSHGLANVPSARSIYCKLMAAAPDSYYAGLTEMRMGLRMVRAESGAAEVTNLPKFLSFKYSFHLERSRELAEMGFTDFAARELAAVEQRARKLKTGWRTIVRYLLAGYSNLGQYSRAARTSITVSKREKTPVRTAVPPGLYRYAYPLAYWPEVDKAASEEKLDPCLILAVMRQESLFDTEALSSAQATGLMQLLPRTALRVARERGFVLPNTAQQLRQPSVNLKLGAAYLAKLLDLTHGSLPKALAAYNAGEDALAMWESRYPNVEEDEFVEHITYRESRSYVKKVMANLRLYHRIYGSAVCSPEMPWKAEWARPQAELKSVREVCG